MKLEKPPLGATSTAKQTTQTDSSVMVPLFDDDNQLAQEMQQVELEDPTSLLEAFREQWKQEISNPKQSSQISHEQEKEDQARVLFLQGVECEKRGEMSEAVHKYTRAMKLVPDIERKVHSHVPAPRVRSTSRTRSSTAMSSRGRGQENTENNLTRTFEERVSKRGSLFSGSSEGSQCILNRFPPEILKLIVCYILGKEINVKALETLSEVSMGMYLLARDNELWRQIHSRSFGTNQTIEKDSTVNWREAYLSFPHLYFDGVYTSKITYIRHGETGFQDNNYRPWHTVVYFRLIRFFADGFALMTTSSESPQASVNLLKSRVPGKADTSICIGTWYQEDDTVVLQLRREYPPLQKTKHTKRNKRAPPQDYGILKHAFHIVLRISPMKANRKWSLQWVQNLCTVTQYNGWTNTTDMEADKNSQDFPPLRFYRVKSYTDGCCPKF